MRIMRGVTKLVGVAACVLAVGFVILAMDDGGPVKVREMPVGEAQRVLVSHGLSVTIAQGQTSGLSMIGRARDLDGVLTSLDGGAFSSSREGNLLTMARRLVDRVLGREVPVRLTLTLPALTAVEGSLGAEINLTDFQAPELEVLADTGAMVLLTGNVESLRIHALSGGAVDASQLAAAHAVIEAASGGTVLAQASVSVLARGGSGASIVVSGSPDQRDVKSATGASVVILE